MQLDLLVDAQPVVQEVGQAVTSARPGLDAQLETARLEVARGEADPPGLQMAVERDEVEAVGRDRDGPFGPSQGPGRRTVNSSPTRSTPSSPRSFTKLASAVGVPRFGLAANVPITSSAVRSASLTHMT
jgi:hypothetical protein